MPVIGTVLNPGSTGAGVLELHKQLLALDVTIAPGEQSTGAFGPSTVAAERSLRKRYGLPPEDILDLSAARLLHVASTFSAVDRRPLRNAVLEAASAAVTSQPQALYWLARYAILAGDYQLAHSIAKRIPNHVSQVSSNRFWRCRRRDCAPKLPSLGPLELGEP